MKNSSALPYLLYKQLPLLLLLSCFCSIAKNSRGQAPFSTTWSLTSDQSYSTTGAGAATVTAVNQAMSGTLFIPAANSYVGTSSGTAGDGQRCSPKLNDGNDGGWVIDGGAVEGRYEEFVVNPNTGYTMNVTNISFSVGNRSRSELKGNAYYYVGATNAGFTIGTGTLLGSSVGSPSTNTWNAYSYTTNINVTSGNKIFVRIYPYNNGSNTTGKYYCTKSVVISGTTVTPNITNIIFTPPVSCNTTQTTISWTGPSGFNSGTQTILAFLKATNAVNAGTPTWPLANYTTVSTTFGTGTGYENDATLARCIYKGTGTDAFGNHSGLTITGLTGGTTYHLLVYVVTGTNSYGSGVVANGAALTATGEPFNNLSSGFVRTVSQTTSSLPIGWTPYTSGTAPYPDGYFLQASNAAIPGTLPTDFTDPGNQPDLTSGTGYVKAMGNSTGTYTWNTGLTAGTMYYFRLNTFTNTGTCINYKTAAPNYTGRTTQIATLPNPVTAPSFSIDGSTGIGTISWNAATGYNNSNHTTLVFIKSGSAVNTSSYSSNQIRNPALFAMGGYYNTNSVFGSGSPAYTFDAAAYPLYNGDGTSCTVTGLTPGTAYHILILTVVVTANSNTGTGTPTQFIEASGATYSTSAYVTTSTVYGGTYTWKPGNTAGNWGTATNWIPDRLAPAVTDQLIFNSGENISPSSFASQTIGSITVTNNTTLNMIAVSQTLTVTNNNGLASNDIIVNTGSTLSINTGMSVTLSANTIANISGTFNVGNSCVYNTSAAGAITTVPGTLVNYNSSITTASTNLVITSTGTYNHANDGGTIPAAAWNTGSVCRVSGINTASGFNGHSQIFSRFVWNCPSQGSQNFVFGVNTSTMEAVDSFIVYSTGAGSLQLTSSSGQRDYTFGNYIQYSGTVSITQATGAGGQRSLAVNNSFYASDSLGNSRFYILNDAVNAGAYGRLFVAGNLVMRKISTNNVILEKVGPASNFGELWFNGNNNQYAQFSTINGNIDFNTAQSVAGFGVTLGSDATAYKFSLTQGRFNIASNTLTINDAVAYPTPGSGTIGGSSTSNLTMGMAGNAGTLNFTSGSRILKNFTQLASNTVTLGTELAITAGITPGRDSLGTSATLNTNDNLILRSDADGTARIAQLPSTAVIAGKVTVERYLPMNTNYDSRRWRLLTAPFKTTNSPTINAAWQQGVSNSNRLAPVNPKPGYGTQITRSTVWTSDGYDQGSTNNTSISYYNAGTWVTPANTNTVKITDNPAYMLFARGDRSTIISNQFVPASPTTLEPKGELNVGNVTIPLASSGFQAVGNPYASAISLDNVQFNDTLGNNKTVYLWDPKALGSYNVGKFIACSGDGVAPFYTYVGNTSNYNAAPGVIESSGAFLVKGNGGSIVFHESDKIITSTTIGIASRPVRNPGSFGTISKLYVDMLAFKNNLPSLADGIAITFNKNYSNSINGMDADKLSTFFTREELSIRREGKLLAIERRKDVDGEDTVFLNISRLNTAAYQFALRPVSFDENYTAFFEDAFLRTSTPVDLINGNIIDFTTTTDSASFAKDRFYIIFKRERTETPVVTNTAFTVFPNPVQNGIVNLQMSSLPAGTYNFKLINHLGQTIQTGRVNHQQGSSVEQFEISETISKGIYKLQLTMTGKKAIVTSLVIQ